LLGHCGMSAFDPKRTLARVVRRSGPHPESATSSAAGSLRCLVRCEVPRSRATRSRRALVNSATCRSRADSARSEEGRRCSKLRTGSKSSVSGNTLSALPRMILTWGVGGWGSRSTCPYVTAVPIKRNSALSDKPLCFDKAPKLDGGLGSGTVAVIAIPLGFRPATASTVHSADFPTSHHHQGRPRTRRRPAPCSALRGEMGGPFVGVAA
jgi:hypothetical protein